MTDTAELRALRVLSIEDSPDFSVLVKRILEREGFDPTIERVDSAVDLEAALDRQRWDVVLSDHSMPSFSSTGALQIIKSRDIDLPFIIVSGFIGEENAVLAMREGAYDYVPKTGLGRLGPAVRRALQDAAERSARKQRERDLELSEARFRTVFAANPSALLISRISDGVILDVNDALVRLTGRPRAELVGSTPQSVGLVLDPAFSKNLRETLAAHGTLGPIERPLHTASGQTRHVVAMFTQIVFGGEQCVLASRVDVSETHEARRALQRAAHYDTLTALPNRTLFMLRLAQRIEAARAKREKFALVYLDLDRFREINEAFGYDAGNAVLVEVAARLLPLDGDEGISRFSEDEFALRLPVGSDEAALRNAAERILDSLRPPFLVSGQPVHLTASLGVVLYPDHGTDAEVLLRRADTAMYAAKRSNTRYTVHSAALDPVSQQRIALASELRQAMTAGELRLFYQPQVEFATGAVAGAEALLRWEHPQRGLVPPAEFIPIAEQTGLINDLTPWVLKQALAQARAWSGKGLRLRIAVNVGMRNLRDPEFLETLDALLGTSGVAPELMSLEITEAATMLEPDRTHAVLAGVRAMGLGVALDDFGTGYSSLAYLSKLPVDEIKIDSSFVTALETSGNRAIARAVIDLGREFGIRVVAEGVKDQRTWDELAAMGCGVAQGFHLTPALPPDEFAEWLRSRG